jgi:mono/diheme cytochrome c family protein
VTKPSTLLLGGLIALAGCSSSSDGNDAIKAASHDAGSATLSHAFGTQCARCHGPSGAGEGIYPALPGDQADADSFVAFVRTGKGEMPAFTTSQISDADLRADFAVLSTK